MKISLLYIIFLAIIALTVSFAAYNLSPVAAIPGETKVFTVARGQGLGQASDKLKDSGLIRSPMIFKLYAFFTGNAHLLKPGVFEINSSESAAGILEKLVHGSADIEVTILEGATLADIDNILADNLIAESGTIKNFYVNAVRADYSFLGGSATLEGFLFPDTYKFSPMSGAESIVRKFLDNFAKKAWPALRDAPDPYGKLVTASLIEKEVPDVGTDRAIVSGIIAKRLSLGMALQIDAAVLYAKCYGELLTCENNKLVRADYSVKSPYNIYLNNGLPPTPIANPGAHAIFAALNPKKTNYLYYLSDPKTKKTIFSVDFDEHNDKRAKYLGL